MDCGIRYSLFVIRYYSTYDVPVDLQLQLVLTFLTGRNGHQVDRTSRRRNIDWSMTQILNILFDKERIFFSIIVQSNLLSIVTDHVERSTQTQHELHPSRRLHGARCRMGRTISKRNSCNRRLVALCCSLVASSAGAFSPATTAILTCRSHRQQQQHQHQHQPRRFPLSLSSRYEHSLVSLTPRGYRDAGVRRTTALAMVAPATATITVASSSTAFFLARIVFLRALAVIYFTAFWIAWKQNKALVGDGGITPARHVLNQAHDRGAGKRQRRLEWRKQHAAKDTDTVTTRNVALQEQDYLRGVVTNTKVFQWLGARMDANHFLVRIREVLWDRSDRMDRPVTSLLWFAKDRNKLDPWLDRIAVTGLLLSTVVMVLGAANVPILLALWMCQRSLMAVGGPWYGFGWEPQLAELGFHALFLVPLLAMKQLPLTPVSPIVLWTLRWFLFRIMMGAGLIKFRSGDRKWKDLTTMKYFYETQPVPNPLTRYYHWLPMWWHKQEVVSNHVVELIAPWLLIVPGVLPVAWRRAAGIVQIAFQGVLITSGNFSFLNWLTMVPAIACLDDALLARLFCTSTVQAAAKAAANTSASTGRQVVSGAFLALIIQLSVPVVRNLLSKHQVMNSSFDPLRLVNSYGAFGTVSEDRDELVISSAVSVDGPWKEYEFQVKPGAIRKRPRWISPYHYRLDWQMWIASTCQTIDRSPWMFNFLLKLLQGDGQVRGLLAKDPWEGSGEDAKYIRVDKFRYKFHKAVKGENDPPYWEREFLGRFYPRQGLSTISSLVDQVST